MIHIAICDDDIKLTADIERMLYALSARHSIDVDIDIFYNGVSLLDYMRQGNSYNILYLDIEMDEMNGMDTAREIRTFDSHVLILYITNHESYAKEAFEVDAFRFLSKPICPDKFASYFADCIRLLNSSLHYFHYQNKRSLNWVAIDSIIYIESDLRRTYIITDKKRLVCCEKLNSIEKRLLKEQSLFYRIHQSYLINPKKITACSYNEITLIDGTVLPVSERRRKKINQLICKTKGDDIIVD